MFGTNVLYTIKDNRNMKLKNKLKPTNHEKNTRSPWEDAFHPEWAEEMFARTLNPDILFWHEYDNYGELSNWYKSYFVIDDFKYFCAEQYIMSQKAKLFHDADRYTEILRASSAKQCKELGRLVSHFDSQKWDSVKYQITKDAVFAKFTQNERLKALLINTGNKYIAEASPYDSVWGTGLDIETTKQTLSSQWTGQNLLGKILMEVRDDINSLTKVKNTKFIPLDKIRQKTKGPSH